MGELLQMLDLYKLLIGTYCIGVGAAAIRLKEGARCLEIVDTEVGLF